MNNLGSQAVLTEKGRKKAEEELSLLINNKRPEVSEKIRTAKEMGDISENAEYAAAKEEQSFNEARILELQNLLKTAEIVTNTGSGKNSTVSVGGTVVVRDNGGKERRFTIVGVNEANPKEGKVTNESPVGQALIGQKKGDTVQVETPNGIKSLTILEIL
ncbi:MAG: transcription elongation factor GreA [Patescibacteria group bacterium]|jgi:transcription elongation factor GreA